MAIKTERVLINSETLQELADRVGERQLEKDMTSTGLSFFTARQMLIGTYAKDLRGSSQNSLFLALEKYGVTRETLFRRVAARSSKAS